MRNRLIRLSLALIVLALISAPILQISRGAAQQADEPENTINLYFFRDDEIGAVVREESRLIQDTSIYFAALIELFRGLADDELGAGLTTRIPIGVTLEGQIAVENGIATVDLSQEFMAGQSEGRDAPPPTIARRMAQVVFTLTRFDEIHAVNFQIEGEAINALDSDGASVFRAVTREDYASITPAILVETPGVWQRLSSPMHLSGTANTFEANVQYRITDARGSSVVAGFFSATSGSGMRGSFDEEIEFEVTRQGRATLVVFEQSAVDGSEINVVAIPIEIVRSGNPTPTSTSAAPTIVQTSPTATPDPSATASATAENTPVPSPTEVPTEVPTSTSEPTSTTEPTATETPVPSATTPPDPTATSTP